VVPPTNVTARSEGRDVPTEFDSTSSNIMPDAEVSTSAAAHVPAGLSVDVRGPSPMPAPVTPSVTGSHPAPAAPTPAAAAAAAGPARSAFAGAAAATVLGADAAPVAREPSSSTPDISEVTGGGVTSDVSHSGVGSPLRANSADQQLTRDGSCQSGVSVESCPSPGRVAAAVSAAEKAQQKPGWKPQRSLDTQRDSGE
jgi:hypothetical protein